jgi:hypothetical protein
MSMMNNERNGPKSVDFKVFGEPLNKLLIAVGYKLAREWPLKYREVIGARELLVMYVRAAQQTYLSSLYLCGDLPRDPNRKPEFCISLAPVNRSLLDSLFTLIFVLEDLPNRCEWFYEASWRETRLELDRLVAEYGEQPDWQSWLKELNSFVNWGGTFARLTPDQASNPKALRSWLNAGAMWRFGIDQNTSLPPARAFMKYLDDYFYIDLSQQSHLTPWGMIKRTGFLLDEIHALPATEFPMKKYRYFQVAQTVLFALAIVSEVEAHFSFGLRQQCLFVWGVAAPVIVIAEEMYRKRYRELLKGS